MYGCISQKLLLDLFQRWSSLCKGGSELGVQGCYHSADGEIRFGLDWLMWSNWVFLYWRMARAARSFSKDPLGDSLLSMILYSKFGSTIRLWVWYIGDTVFDFPCLQKFLELSGSQYELISSCAPYGINKSLHFLIDVLLVAFPLDKD